MAESVYTDRLEALVVELLKLDERRVAIVFECGNDLARGVELTRPIIAEHKRVLAELRALVDDR